MSTMQGQSIRNLLRVCPSALPLPRSSPHPQFNVPITQLGEQRLPAMSLPQGEYTSWDPEITHATDELRLHIARAAYRRRLLKYNTNKYAPTEEEEQEKEDDSLCEKIENETIETDDDGNSVSIPFAPRKIRNDQSMFVGR